MECIICGKEFETLATRGVKPKYCSNDCKKIGMSNSRKKYIEKLKREKEIKKIDEELIARKDTSTKLISEDDDKFIRKDEIICRKSEASLYATKYISDVVELGRKLGAVLFEAKELKEKLSKEQSEHDKIGHEILQYYESPGEITVEKAIEIAVKASNMRTPRRDIKVLIEIIDNLVRNIPSNPPAFVSRAIQNKEKTNEYYANKKEL